MFFDDAILDALAKGAILSALGLFWIIFLVRVVGLRSFSKMTNFDFVMTVAMGSLLAGASQSSEWTGLLQTLTAMASLFAVQYLVAYLRQRSATLDDLVKETRVRKEDLVAKLREANALDLSQVQAVILETTGDISVLHGAKCDEILTHGVREV